MTGTEVWLGGFRVRERYEGVEDIDWRVRSCSADQIEKEVKIEEGSYNKLGQN